MLFLRGAAILLSLASYKAGLPAVRFIPAPLTNSSELCLYLFSFFYVDFYLSSSLCALMLQAAMLISVISPNATFTTSRLAAVFDALMACRID